MKISEIMTTDVKVIDPEHSLKQAAIAMRENDIGSLPVGENDKLIGMVTDRDITVRGVADGLDTESTKVRDVMSPGVTYCYEEDDLTSVAESMARHQVRRLPVINQDKRLVGAVAIADLARAREEEGETLSKATQGVSQA